MNSQVIIFSTPISIPFKDLIECGLWDENMKNRLVSESGSIQRIDNIPQYIKELYKTVWEMSQKDIIEVGSRKS